MENKPKRPYNIRKSKPIAPFHMGKEIKAIVKMKKFKIKDLCEIINCERQTLYLVFKTEYLTGDNIVLFSKILEYDFFELFSEKLFGRKDQIKTHLTKQINLLKAENEMLKKQLEFEKLLNKSKEFPKIAPTEN